VPLLRMQGVPCMARRKWIMPPRERQPVLRSSILMMLPGPPVAGHRTTDGEDASQVVDGTADTVGTR
jgi:hypothetical protein